MQSVAISRNQSQSETHLGEGDRTLASGAYCGDRSSRGEHHGQSREIAPGRSHPRECRAYCGDRSSRGEHCADPSFRRARCGASAVVSAHPDAQSHGAVANVRRQARMVPEAVRAEGQVAASEGLRQLVPSRHVEHRIQWAGEGKAHGSRRIHMTAAAQQAPPLVTRTLERGHQERRVERRREREPVAHGRA